MGTVRLNLGRVVGPQGPKGDKGDKGDPGERGARGLSVYEEWLANGNAGSFSQFVDSLRPSIFPITILSQDNRPAIDFYQMSFRMGNLLVEIGRFDATVLYNSALISSRREAHVTVPYKYLFKNISIPTVTPVYNIRKRTLVETSIFNNSVYNLTVDLRALIDAEFSPPAFTWQVIGEIDRTDNDEPIQNPNYEQTINGEPRPAVSLDNIDIHPPYHFFATTFPQSEYS